MIEQKSPAVIEANPSELLLDSRNYRFAEDRAHLSQEELIRLLDMEFDPLEIGKSLAENGYFAQEPLVGIPASADPEVKAADWQGKARQYIVVEGNRRLAAILLLTKPLLSRLVPHRTQWEALARSTTHRFDRIPIFVYEKREDVLRYLGQRHITGTKKWGPLAKARFLYELGNKVGRPARVEEIAEISGTEPDSVVQFYATYATLVQAKTKFHMDTMKWEAGFSVLQRLLTYYPTMATFVGFKATNTRALGNLPIQALQNPIKPTKQEEFEELISYVFGLPGKPSVISESRGLGDLNKVLKSEQALKRLRETRDLDGALEYVEAPRSRLLTSISKAERFLRKTVPVARRFRKDEAVQDAVKRCAETMAELLQYFPAVRLGGSREK